MGAMEPSQPHSPRSYERSWDDGYHISSGGEMYWFANLLRKEPPSRVDLDMIVSEEWQERMPDLFREDMPVISNLIRATESTIIGHPFYDIPTQPLWHKGRVVLVGDAIHAVSPSAGQGASLSVEDAVVLARCLRDQEDYLHVIPSPSDDN